MTKLEISLDDYPIKIKHLMSHSSGLPNLGTATVLITRHAPLLETWVPLSSKDDFYTFVNSAKEEIVDQPGKRFFYFNTGYTLLGEIIEAVSGISYIDYIKKHILDPLKMKRSTFLEEVFYEDKDRMTANIVEKNKPVAKKHPFDQLIYAAGGLLSSAKEMSNFLLMLLNKGFFEGERIISEESLEEMFKIQIEYPVQFLGRSGYGFGLAISEDFLGNKLVSHGGSTRMSSAQFAFIPEKNIGIFTEANVGAGMGGIIAETILAMLLEKNPEEVIPYYRIVSKMEQFSGEYANYKGLSKVKIFIENGMLVAETEVGDSTAKYALIPEDIQLDNNEFYIYSFGYKTPIKFEIKEDGKIDVFVERTCFHKIK